jgi:hypothetical protein
MKKYAILYNLDACSHYFQTRTLLERSGWWNQGETIGIFENGGCAAGVVVVDGGGVAVV